MPMKSWSIATLILLVPLTSQATDIRQRPFRYSLDAVTAKADDQFVVCTECQDNQLSRMPMAPKLAVRMTTTPLKLEIPDTQKAQQTQSNKGETVEKTVRVATMQFDFDSEKLSRYERERLDGLLRDLPRSSTYDLTGYTCTIGTNDYNERLSFRRVNHVAGILKSGGLNVVTVEGKGKCCPVSTEKRLNRRVEILEHQKEEKWLRPGKVV